MTAYEIPLISQPQTLSISLAGTTYNLRVTWCNPLGAWVLDVNDVNDDPIVNGIPLITGINLLAPYAYLGIGGRLVVQSDFDVNAMPTFANLGQTSHLYFLTSP